MSPPGVFDTSKCNAGRAPLSCLSRLDVTGQGDGWCAVTYDTIPGYVMERYLILDGETEEKPKTDAERLEALENQAAEFERRIAVLEGGAG